MQCRLDSPKILSVCTTDCMWEWGGDKRVVVVVEEVGEAIRERYSIL